MSVVIIGGNECMFQQYKTLCGQFNCKAKIYPKMSRGIKDIGSPDLLVLFTGTVSHKMIHCALSDAKKQNTRVARSHSSSIAALRHILEANTR